jgi:hypothetical protein
MKLYKKRDYAVYYNDDIEKIDFKKKKDVKKSNMYEINECLL